MEQSDIVEKAQDSLKKLASTSIGMSLTAWDEVSNNLLECTTEITRLRAALADAQAVGFAAGVEAAKTAVSLNAWKHGGDDAYSVGMDVGARQQNEQDLAAIRALTPPDLTAAAARVLLDDMDKSAVDHPDAVARWGKANEAMGRDAGAWRALMTGLLAIAGDTP